MGLLVPKKAMPPGISIEGGRLMARCLRCGSLRGCSVGLGADGGQRSRFVGSDICQNDIECMFNVKIDCRFRANGGWNCLLLIFGVSYRKPLLNSL